MGTLLTCLLAASACPSPHGVLERVERLGGRDPRWAISFTPSGDSVHFEATKDGVAVSRDLDAKATCEELEEAAAVMIRARESEQPAVRRRRVLAVSVPDQPSAREGAVLHFEGGLGPSLVVDGGGGVALGGLVFLQLRVARFPAALGAAFTGATLRSLPLGEGTVSWARISIGVGPEVPLSVGTTSLNFSAHVISGPVFLSYLSAAEATSTVTANLGVRAGARLGFRGLEGPQFFIGLSATAWIVGPRPKLTAEPPVVALPWLDLDVVAGLSWGG